MDCLPVQEDSEKTGKVTSAGMYFLHFQVYRMDSTVNAVCICVFPSFPLLFIMRGFRKWNGYLENSVAVSDGQRS